MFVVLNWGIDLSDALLLCDEEGRALVFDTHKQAEEFKRNVYGNTLIVDAYTYQPAVDGAYCIN